MAPTSFFLILLFFFFFSVSVISGAGVVILAGNSTVLSSNRTFTLGFFNPNPQQPAFYLGIWYTSIPTPVYVWVANRHTPFKTLSSAALTLAAGRLTLSDPSTPSAWNSDNSLPASEFHFSDSGNIQLLSPENDVIWQSFDHPTDTWLPGMNLTAARRLTSWRSLHDPSPGKFSLRVRPPTYGEIELISGDTSYWNTGNWTGSSFPTIPQMTVNYIYKFYFISAFSENATFGFSETALDGGFMPLTRFHLNLAGQLQQFSWSPQTLVWNSFWAGPDNPCRSFGLCGEMGVCSGESVPGAGDVCGCLGGFNPVDEFGWSGEDFSGGCRRKSECGGEDEFEEVGVAVFDDRSEVKTVSFEGSSGKICERECLVNCSCIGFYYSDRAGSCRNLFGSLLNIRNSSTDSAVGDDQILFIRVGKSESAKPRNGKISKILLVALICGFTLVSVFIGLAALMFRLRMIRKRREEEEAMLSVTNLKVFSYKELHSATRGFSEKLGHGGFGTVFRGVVSGSPVAVKRLERPGGGEREFRAEVCTIGNIQHVNLVRLRGFCSEESHRLLVYDCMPNGALSAYLKKDGQVLSWEIRVRVAIGTARALAYLHEGCRDCIIHCDIKPENILLNSDYAAKVSDFGLAKLIGRDFSRVLATMRGTWGYVAPEWISGVAITNKADVYSYGMTMLELISGRRNVEAPPASGGGVGGGGGGGEEKWFFPPWAARRIIEGDVGAVVDPRLGEGYRGEEVRRLGMVAVWCIQDEEGARPTMGMVVKMLEGVVEVGVPPPPKLLQALVSGESFMGVVSGSQGNASFNTSQSV